MENRSNQDPLEELFREQLNHPSGQPAEDGWDMPSEKVWEGIAAGITPRAGRFDRRLTGAVLLLFLLFAFLLVQNLNLHRRLEIQSKELAVLKDRMAVMSAEKPVAASGITAQTTKKDGIFNEDLSAPGGKNKSDRDKVFLTQAENQVRKTDNITPGQTANFKKTDPAIFADLSENENAGTTDALNNSGSLPAKTGGINSPEWQHSVNEYKEDSPVNLQGPLNRLYKNIELLKSQVYFPQQLNLIQPIAKITPVSSKINFRIGPYFGAGITGSRIRYAAGSGTSPFFRDWEKADLSEEWGVNIAVDLGRNWSIHSGFGKYGIRQVSRQVFLVRYDPSLEIATSSGEYKSDYQLKAQSSLGESDIEVEFRRQNSQPAPANQTVRVAVGLRQRIDYTTIPLMIGYSRPIGPFDLGVRAGSSVNFVGRQSLSASAQSQLQGIRTHAARVLRTFRTDRQTIFNLELGADLAYNAGKNWQLFLGPHYRTNLIPVKKAEEFDTKTYAWSLQLGLNFKLNK